MVTVTSRSMQPRARSPTAAARVARGAEALTWTRVRVDACAAPAADDALMQAAAHAAACAPASELSELTPALTHSVSLTWRTGTLAIIMIV